MKIDRVSFIEPGAPGKHVFSKTQLPRLGAVLLASMLHDRGFHASVHAEDVQRIDWDDVLGSDLVCVSTITSTAARAYSIADRAKKSGIPVVMGGPHPSFTAEECLEHSDFVIRGEGEVGLPALIEALETGSGFDGVPGLSYRESPGEIVHNPASDFIKDLDSVPDPDFELVRGWHKRNNRIYPICASRGCPYGCRFCAVIQMFGRKYRFASVDKILGQIRALKGKAASLFFVDDNFAASRRHTRELLKGMIAMNDRLSWTAQVRVDTARDDEILSLMRRSHCYAVFVGFESVNPRTLEAYNKSQSLEDIEMGVRAFHKNRIKVHGMFVLGSDEDDYTTARQTCRFAKRLGIDSVQFLVLTPIPGTPVYEEMREQDRLICADWSKYDGHHTVYRPMKMSAYELQHETYRAMRRFYTWGSMLNRLIRFDIFFAMIRIYSRITLRRGYADSRSYLLGLKGNLYAKFDDLRERFDLSRRRLRRVGLPSVLLEQMTSRGGGYSDFLPRFLGRLGVEVMIENGDSEADGPAGDSRVHEIAASLRQQVARLQEKVDLILVPVAEQVSEKGKALLKTIEEIRPAGPITVSIDLKKLESDFYTTCMEIGLIFKGSIGTVRRAYFATLAEMAPA